MRTKLSPITQRAVIVAGRFGFISRDIFWKHISRRQKSENYANWKRLTDLGIFKVNRLSTRYLQLSRTGIQILQQMDGEYVGPAHPLYFDHDELVMGLALACENAGLIKANWQGDAVIRGQTNEERVQLLGSNSDKIPDLVFDLNVQGAKIRVALEVERARKSLHRIDSLVLSYMEMRAVDLVLIACSDRYIEQRIRDSIKKLGYPQTSRPMAFCKLGGLAERPDSFPIQLSGNVICFDKFVTNLRKLEGGGDSTSIKKLPEASADVVPEISPGNIPVEKSA